MNLIQSPEEYSVFDCVLSHENYSGDRVERLVVVSDPMPLHPHFAQYLEKLAIPGVPQEMLDDLRTKCREPLFLQNKFHLRKPVAMVPKAEIEQLFGSKDKLGWSRFRERFPNAGGITTLSGISFNAGRTHALVYVGNGKDWLSGSGIVFFLGRADGSWKIEQSRIVWLS